MEPEENGDTFTANAVIKAEAAAAHTGRMSLADDSGLQVDALLGGPGIYSARYAGPGADAAARNRKLIQELAGVPWELRQARFVCAIALAIPGEQTWTAQGVHEGYILETVPEIGGFGYDPVFYSPELGATFAAVALEQKNAVSHRARALAQLNQYLQQISCTQAGDAY